MYKFHYDHLSNRLDIQFILDTGDAETENRSQVLWNCLRHLKVCASLVGDFSHVSDSACKIDGSVKLWIQSQNESYGAEYCEETIFLCSDHFIFASSVLFRNKNLVVIGDSVFELSGNTLYLFKRYTAVRMLIDVESIHKRFFGKLKKRNLHFEGNF